MHNKRIFLIVLSSAVLLAVIVSGLIGFFLSKTAGQTNTPTTAQANTSSTNTGPLLHLPLQNQDTHYPDPSDQQALPDSVKVTSSGDTVILRASVSEGEQIYTCQISATDPNSFAWKLQAPSALLKTDNGATVLHSTDPSWLYTADGSEVKGKVGQYSKPDGTSTPASATPDASSVPWLRLDVTAHTGNSGILSKVDQIQRLYTKGGNAPKDGCDSTASNNHAITAVTYSAEYVFWGH